MDVKSIFSVSQCVFMFVAIGTTALPVPVSYDGLLTLDVVRDDRIVGDFYPQENVPEWYVKFSVVAENDKIVSRSELVLVREKGRVPFTVLKIPAENKRHKIIVFPTMRGMVLQAAKDTFATYKANKLPDIRELVDAFDNLANAVHRRLSLSSVEVYQFASSIMYHSTIIGSVWRLTEGATESNAVCRMSLTFANRIRYLLCAQDIHRISSKSENFIDEDEINTMGERLSKRADDSDGSGSGFVPGGGNGGKSGPSNGGGNGGTSSPSNGGGNGGKSGPSNGGGNGGTSGPSNGGGNGGTGDPSNGGGGNTNNPPTVSTTASPTTTSQATGGIYIRGKYECEFEFGIDVTIEECLEWLRDKLG